MGLINISHDNTCTSPIFSYHIASDHCVDQLRYDPYSPIFSDASNWHESYECFKNKLAWLYHDWHSSNLFIFKCIMHINKFKSAYHVIFPPAFFWSMHFLTHGKLRYLLMYNLHKCYTFTWNFDYNLIMQNVRDYESFYL